jgi:hypothetical protein
MDSQIRMHTNPNIGADRKRDPNEIINGFAFSYLRLCRGQGFEFASQLTPEPGDWILGENVPEDMRLAGVPAGDLQEKEVVVPSLTRLVHLLRQEAHAVVIDCYPEDFACMCFNEGSFSLANIVSRNPEEAAFRALLFIVSEKKAQEAANSQPISFS